MATPIVKPTHSQIKIMVGAQIAATSLFTASDADGTIDTYSLFDGGVNSGEFWIGDVDYGVRVDVSASDLASVVFIAGPRANTEGISVLAYDGTHHSTEVIINVTTTAPTPPTLALAKSTMTAYVGQRISFSDLFTLSGQDSTIDSYLVTGKGASLGTFYDVQPDTQEMVEIGTSVAVYPSDKPNIVFIAGSKAGTETISINASTTYGTITNTKTLTLTVVPFQVPTVTLAHGSISVTVNGQIAATKLFSATEPAGTIDSYTLIDGGTNPGYFLVGGNNVGSSATFSASQLASVYFVAGTALETDMISVQAFDSGNSSQSSVKTLNAVIAPPPPPTVTIAHASIIGTYGTTIAASNLFTAADPATSITSYILLDTTSSRTSGHFELNGNLLDPNGTIAASDLSSVDFVVAKGGTDIISIQAVDQYGFSSIKKVSVTVTPPVPTLALNYSSGTNIDIAHGAALNAALLFDAQDPNDIPFVKYNFLDANMSATAGHFVLNGVVEVNGTAFTVTADQLGQLTYVAGSGNDAIQIKANDGFNWSNTGKGTIVTPADNAPVVTGANVAVSASQSVNVSSLFAVTDADSDPITKFQVQDLTGTGKLKVNGTAVAANAVASVSALSAATFTGGNGVDQIRVRAWDGLEWGAWSTVSVGEIVTNAGFDIVPVTTLTIAATHLQSFAAWHLFTVSTTSSDATKYQFEDLTPAADSGHFTLDTASGTITEAATTIFSVNASALGSVNFLTGSGSDQIMVRAFDGATWSNWTTVTLAAPQNQAPVVTSVYPNGLHAAAGSSSNLAGLFDISDPENDAIVKYQVQDVTSGGGVLKYNNATIATGTAASVTSLNSVSLTIGTGLETIRVRAFDGLDWGAWTKITIGYVPPVVTAGNPDDGVTAVNNAITATTHTQLFAASDLFTATTSNPDITKYQFLDNTAATTSGSFTVRGNVVAAGNTITATDLSSVSFRTGIGGSDSIQVRVNDGTAWSAWKTITVTAAVDTAPVITPNSAVITVPSWTAATFVGGLFSATDPDGDAITQYQFEDLSGTGTMLLNNVKEAKGTTFGTTGLTLVRVASGDASDTFKVRAWDGYEWGAWTNVTIAPQPIVNPGSPVAVLALPSLASSTPASNAVASPLATTFDTLGKHQWGLSIPS